MSKIKDISIKEILDTRGLPAVETEIRLNSGICGKSIIPIVFPSGTYNLNGEKINYKSYCLDQLKKIFCEANEKVKKYLINLNPHNQEEIDDTLNKIIFPGEELGINYTLAISIANIKSSSNESKIPLFLNIRQYFENDNKFYLPTPMINMINGGLNANNTISFQDFAIIPTGANSFNESLRYGTEIFYVLKSLLKKHGHNTNIGDAGGFSPNLRSNQEAIEYILLAIEKSSLSIGKDIFLGLDIAGNELYKKNKVFFFKKNYASIIETFMELTEKLVRDYPIISLEDPFCEKDFFSWKYLNKRIGKKIQLIGDDIFSTNECIIKNGIDNELANALVIKLNQNKTVTEAIKVVKLAKKKQLRVCIV